TLSSTSRPSKRSPCQLRSTCTRVFARLAPTSPVGVSMSSTRAKQTRIFGRKSGRIGLLGSNLHLHGEFDVVLLQDFAHQGGGIDLVLQALDHLGREAAEKFGFGL